MRAKQSLFPKAAVLGILCLLSGLSGCSLFPVAPTYDAAALSKGPKPMVQIDVFGARALVSNWEAAMNSSAQDRRRAELVSTELQFYGTLAFAAASAYIVHAGGLASVSHDVVLTRNYGAATAFGSMMLANHYDWATQRQAFTKASDRLACGRAALTPLNPAVAEMLNDKDLAAINTQLDPAKFDNVWAAIPGTVQHWVEREVNADLQADLMAVKLAVPSNVALSKAFGDWKTATDQGGQAADDAKANTPTPGASPASIVHPQFEALTLGQPVLPVIVTTKVTEAAPVRAGGGLALVQGNAPSQDGQITIPPKTPQEIMDREEAANRTSAEVLSLKSSFIVGLVSFNAALALCK